MKHRYLAIALMVWATASAQAATPLIEAAKSGDLAGARALGRRSIDINAAEADGSTALLWAVHRADAPMVHHLLDRKADPNLANRYGVSPLLEASRLGEVSLIQALLAAGGDMTRAARNGETPLMAAAGAGSAAAVALLIDRGGDVNAREQAEDETALMWASAAGHLEVVRLLLARGADPNLAARSLDMPEPALRSNGRNWPDFSRGNLTALMFAAREGHAGVVQALLEAGADPKVRTVTGLTALLIAIYNDQLDIAEVLVDRGADPSDGSLYELIQLRNLRKDATIDATRPRPDHDNTLTTLALLQHLLARGGDANRVVPYKMNLDGPSLPLPVPVSRSAYMNALTLQDVEALHIFLEAGAVDPNATGEMKERLTPLMMTMTPARGGGGPGGRKRPPFREPGERSALAAAELLIAAGADVNGAAASGDTALHRAAQANDADLIRILTDRGAALEARNAGGLTPLDVAMAKKAANAPEVRDQFGDVVVEQPKPAAVAALKEALAGRDRQAAVGR